MLENTYWMSMIHSRCCDEVFRSKGVKIGDRNSSKFNFVVSLIGLGAVCGFGFGLTKKYPAIKNASSSLYQTCLRYLFPARPQSLGAPRQNNESSTIKDLHLEKPTEELRTPLERALSEWVQKSSSHAERAIRLENQKIISDAYRSNTLYLKGDLTQLPSILWQESFIERLESLELLGCNLDSIPKEIASAKNLKFFKIEGSRLSQFPADLISKLDKLTLFKVENNRGVDVDQVDFINRSSPEKSQRKDSLSVNWNQQLVTYLYSKGAGVSISIDGVLVSAIHT